MNYSKDRLVKISMRISRSIMVNGNRDCESLLKCLESMCDKWKDDKGPFLYFEFKHDSTCFGRTANWFYILNLWIRGDHNDILLTVSDLIFNSCFAKYIVKTKKEDKNYGLCVSIFNAEKLGLVKLNTSVPACDKCSIFKRLYPLPFIDYNDFKTQLSYSCSMEDLKEENFIYIRMKFGKTIYSLRKEYLSKHVKHIDTMIIRDVEMHKERFLNIVKYGYFYNFNLSRFKLGFLNNMVDGIKDFTSLGLSSLSY